MAHGYDKGRLNLPFVGIATFGKYDYQPDWSAIDADVAVVGAPYDFGTQWRPGARFGPRAIREASTLFAFGHAGAYDHEDDVTYLGEGTRIVDIGDADIVHTDTEQSHARIEDAVRAIRAAGALPVVMGGDHSINIPCIRASVPLLTTGRSIFYRSMRIWISSMNATAYGTATATRCAARRNRIMSRACRSLAFATCHRRPRTDTRMPARWGPIFCRCVKFGRWALPLL